MSIWTCCEELNEIANIKITSRTRNSTLRLVETSFEGNICIKKVKKKRKEKKKVKGEKAPLMYLINIINF